MVVLSIVKGPQVVACYGGSTEPEDEFIVMELMEAPPPSSLLIVLIFRLSSILT